jgi:hypothetical protein
VGLREDIEAAFGEAAAEGGVRLLAVDGDDEVWVAGLGATDEPLELPGFDLDGDARLSVRRVEPGEAVAAARTALDAVGVGPGDPLLMHLGD